MDIPPITAKHGRFDTSQSGSLYLAGWTSDLPASGSWTSGFIIKTSSTGDTIWSKRFGNESAGSHTYFRTLSTTSDGGCIAVGETNQYGAGGYDVVAVKLQANGDTIWTKTFGSSGDDYGWNVKQTSDNGYIICGNTSSFADTIKGDMLIIRLNSDGDVVWAKTIGDAGAATTLDAARCIIETSDNHFLLCGYSGIPGTTPASDEDGVVIKLDGLDGDTLWTKRYTIGTENEHFRYVSEISPGDYLVSGYSASLGTGEDDILFLKVKEFGFAGGCYEAPILPAFQVNTPSLLTSSGIPSHPTGFTVSAMSNSTTPVFTENMLCDSTIITGTEDLTEPKKVSYYPNPVINELTISIPTQVRPREVSVFNLLGETLQTTPCQINNGEIIIDFSSSSTGIYFVSLTMEDGKRTTVRVIKN